MNSVYGRINEFPVLFLISYYFLGVLIGLDCKGSGLSGWIFFVLALLAFTFSLVWKVKCLRWAIPAAFALMWLGFILFGLRAAGLRPADIDISYPRRLEGVVTQVTKRHYGHSLAVKIRKFRDRNEIDGRKAVNSFLRLKIPDMSEDIMTGDAISILIWLGKSFMCRNLDSFCLRRSEVYQFKGFLKDGTEIERLKEKNPFKKCVSFARRKIASALSKIEDSEAKGVFLGILLGHKEGLTPKIKRDYRACGLVHVLVVSGFNIGMVFFLFYYVFRFLLSNFRVVIVKHDIQIIASVLSLVPAYFYSELTGLPYPTLRALLMLLLFVICFIFKRPFIGLNILFWTAFIISIFEPVSFFSISFELSCAAVFGIMYGMGKTRNFYLEKIKRSDFGRFSGRIWIYFLDLFFMTLFAIIFTLPISAYYFGSFSLTGIPANLIFVPVFSIVLFPAGIAAMIFSIFSLPLDGLLWKAGIFAVSKVDCLISVVAKIPYSLVKTPKIHFEDVFLYYCLIMFILNFKLRASRIIPTVLVLMVLVTKQLF